MKIYVIAGEKSGDKQGALLMKELLARRPDTEFYGLGGSEMHAVAEGVRDWAEQAAVIGVVEVLCHARFFLRELKAMERRIAEDKPALLILIDYPGFNQRLAERVHKRCPDTKIAWFIAPMVWAWHKGRLPKLARDLDLMLCTFPFEKIHFENAGLRTEFVGHPLADDIAATKQSDKREENLIGLFPGSRSHEIEKHFPVFLQLIRRAKEKHPEWHFEVSASNPRLELQMRKIAAHEGFRDADLPPIGVGTYHELMDRATVALVTSGTATLEAALHDLPFILVYKVAWGTYILGRLLLTIRFIGMVNILADAPVTTELIQHDFSPQRCMQELEKLMLPEQRKETLRNVQAAVSSLSRRGGAAAQAAEAILSLLEQKGISRS